MDKVGDVDNNSCDDIDVQKIKQDLLADDECDPNYSNIILLEQHPELIEKDIVRRYILDSRTNNIIIELNHAYRSKRVNICARNYDSIEELRKALKKLLVKEKDIQEDHAKLLVDVIDNNADMINDACYAYPSSKEEEEREGEDLEEEEVVGGSKKPSEAEVILDVLQKGELIHELFVDQYDTPYAAIKVDDHVETISMRTKASTQFKNWICYNLYKETNTVPKDESLNSVLNVLRAKACYEGKVRKLYLRAGPASDKPNEILYDFTNKDWEFVRITPEGWSIEKSSTITTPVFKRYRNQLAQVHPSKEYPSDIFDQFMNLLNVKDANAKLLLKVYIILLIYYKIQKPILAPYGEQGSAKSTLHEYIKQVIDPSAAVTLAFPRDVNELVQKLDHNYIAYFDNISKIPEWISDQFCRAVTGSGFSKRQLYTDEDDIIFSFKRALGFNGINLAATKADLLDRCLIIMLERIKEDKRQPLEDIVNIKGLNHELERIKPRLLGYIFDILSKVLKTISTGGIARPKELPRMADFAIHGEIVARCLGYDEGVFLNAFNDNIKLQTDELIESNPLAMTVFQFVQWTPEFKGTATELLGQLNFKAAEIGIQTDKFWPKGPGALSRRLNLIRTSLRRIGVDIEFYEHTGKGSKSRGIKVYKIPSEASESSVTSDIDPNQTRIHTNASDDIIDDNDDTNKVSSEGSAKNRAQNGTSDNMYDTDDSFQISSSPPVAADNINKEKNYSITRVVHCLHEPYDIYIGRESNRYQLKESKWHNPYIIGKDGTREEVMWKYKNIYFPKRLDLIAAIPELKGKVLGCHCAPDPCHGNFLKGLADGSEYIYSCYYCDHGFTNDKHSYEKHVISTHGLKHPCYPTKGDIERLKLTPQGKYWEE